MARWRIVLVRFASSFGVDKWYILIDNDRYIDTFLASVVLVYFESGGAAVKWCWKDDHFCFQVGLILGPKNHENLVQKKTQVRQVGEVTAERERPGGDSVEMQIALCWLLASYTFYEFLLTMTLEESKDSRSGWLSVIYHKTQTKNVEVEALFGCHVSTLSLGRHARAFQSTAEAGWEGEASRGGITAVKPKSTFFKSGRMGCFQHCKLLAATRNNISDRKRRPARRNTKSWWRIWRSWTNSVHAMSTWHQWWQPLFLVEGVVRLMAYHTY